MDDDRDFGFLPQLAQQFHAVGVWQAQVEHDDVRLFFERRPHRSAGFGNDAVDAGRRQCCRQNMAGDRIVFNDERCLAHDSCFSGMMGGNCKAL